MITASTSTRSGLSNVEHCGRIRARRQGVQTIPGEAKRSTGEGCSLPLRHSGYMRATDFDEFMILATHTSQLIAGFMRYLNQSPLQGNKYRPA